MKFPLPYCTSLLPPVLTMTTLPILGTTMPSTFKIPRHIIAGCLRFFISNWKILTREMDTQHNTGLSYPSTLSTETDQSTGVGLTEGQQRGLEPGITQTPEEKHYHSSNRQRILSVFISPIFTIPKKSREQRLTINLRKLNKFVRKEHFKPTYYEIY